MNYEDVLLVVSILKILLVIYYISVYQTLDSSDKKKTQTYVFSDSVG
jgi:hypothetical protein